MRLTLGVYEYVNGPLIADFSHNARNITPSTGEHGFEALTFDVPLSLAESFHYYDLLGNKWVQLSNGAGDIWEGFVEKVGPIADGLTVAAMGTWRQLSRDKYTALWSDSNYQVWQQEPELINAENQKYVIDQNNRLYIALKKNETYQTSSDLAVLYYDVPHLSNRDIKGVSFDYEFLLPTNWEAELDSFEIDYSSGAYEWQLTGNGSVRSGSVNINLASESPRLVFAIYNKTGSPYTLTSDTGVAYFKITNLRIVTTTTNRVNTTTTTTISAGSTVVTPASMSGVYLGQKLQIDQGYSTSETVTVTAVSSTTFTATFANAYSGTTTIHAHVVRPDEIIGDIVDQVSALDGVYLSDSTALIDNPEIDLLNEVYEDANPIEVCTKLAGLGDADGNVWEVGVMDDQTLYYRQRASAGRQWYVDPQDLTVMRDIGVLANSVYATYKDENGRILRTAASENTNSQSIYGATVKSFVSVNTTNEEMAKNHRDVALADGATPAPQVGFLVTRLFDASGAPYPLYEARNGDMVTLRSLSPVLSSDIDRIRTFRVAGHSYNANDDALMMIPERPLPMLERMVARQGEGIF